MCTNYLLVSSNEEASFHTDADKARAGRGRYMYVVTHYVDMLFQVLEHTHKKLPSHDYINLLFENYA